MLDLSPMAEYIPNVMTKSSKTDWDRVEAMDDAAINASDIPPLSEAFLEKSRIRYPLPPEDQGDLAAAIFAESEAVANDESPISWEEGRKQLGL